MSRAKPSGKSNVAPPAPAAKGGFDAKAYAKNGISEEEVASCKAAFDLFDTDQGGSVDIKGISVLTQNSKQL